MRAYDHADFKKIAGALGIRRSDLKAAEGEALFRDLGMMPGGVAPLPINGAMVVFDKAVLDLDTIF
jgi:Cys-tRNA(Pro)/Cys-tRNA(Cys) deacylase